MRISIVLPASLLVCGLCALAQGVSQSGVSQSTLPDSLRVPEAQKLLFQAHGAGDQIYTCAAANRSYAWVLKAPDAQLTDSAGQVLGRHFAGPTWEAKDGSRVVGKAAAHVDAPDPQSIPWLRVDAVSHEGTGTMGHVVSIQRLRTKGGKAPVSGCDEAHAGTESRVTYEADYYFYGTVE